MSNPNNIISYAVSVPKNIKAVLFDWDNTLARNAESYRLEYFLRTFTAMEQRGYVVPKNFQLSDVGSRSISKYFESLWEKDGASVALGMMHEIYGGMKPQPKLMEGSRETLQKLVDRNIPIAIISSRPDSEVKQGVHDLLGEEFSNMPVFGMSESGIRKPDPRAFSQVLDKLGVRASRDVYMVGDHSIFDVCGAREFGITPIHFGRDTSKPYHIFDGTSPAHASIIKHSLAVENHQELQNLLDSIYRGENSLPIFSYKNSAIQR